MFKKSCLALILLISGLFLNSTQAAPSATVNVLAEFGKTTVTNNTYTTINLNNTYTNLVVVASPRYTTTQGFRTARVRNKTASSFQIKVDNDTNNFVGSTTVDWLAFEAGDYNLDTGAGVTRLVAGSTNVSNVACKASFTTAGNVINFAPAFSVGPNVLHTVTTEADPDWIFSSVHDGANRANPAAAGTMTLTLQRSFASCSHLTSEDIDYVAIESVHGTNNTNELESLLTPDNISCCTGTGYNVNFATAFPAAPEVIIVAQNAEDGGDGGFAIVHTGTAPAPGSFTASIDEGTAGARTHTTEEVSVIAFAPSSGELAEVTSNPWNLDGNLRLWLRADELALSDGDPVSTWTDTSVNSNDLIQAGGLRPAFRDNSTDNINFNPVLDFDGIDDFLEDADGENYLNGQNAVSAFFVIESDSATADVGFFRTDTSAGTDNGLSIRYDLAGLDGGQANVIKFGDGSATTQTGESSANSQSTKPQLLDLFRDTGSPAELYINGLQNTLSDTPANSAVIGALDYLRVGDHSKGVWDGSVAEVLLYTEVLSANDRRIVESYLALKYGMALDQSGTGANYLSSTGGIIFDADTAGSGTGAFNSFNNDIFGLGQDDSSLLDHTLSKSINSDAIITISNPSALDDGDFIVIGNDDDDNGVIEETTAETGANLIARLDREWKVDVTGTPGTLTLAFDLTGITVSGTSANDFRLIVDSVDSDFSNGFSKAFKASTFASNILTFNNVTLVDGDVFTVSAGDIGPGGITGVELWHRASDLALADGAAVTNIDDFSVFDNDGIASTAPTFRNNSTDNINFNPVLEYNGTSNSLAIENLSYTGTNAISDLYSCSIFRTSFVNVANNQNWAFLDFDRSEYFNYYIQGDGGIDFSYAAGGINDNVSTANGYNDGLPHLACVFYDGALVNDTIIRADGLDLLNANSEPTLNQTIGTANTRFGLIGDGSEASTFNGTKNNIFYDGDIAETIYYVNRKINSSERNRIESYLASKYGITLDQSGTGQNYFDSAGNIVFDADTAGAGTGFMNSYANDIAGIGVDNDSTLNQVQSRSVNGDSIISVANATSLDNTDFLFWGNDNDDNGTIETISTNKPLSIDVRLDRVWRIDETGETGTVDISFDISGLGLVGADADSLKLLRDTDTNFSAGATAVDALSFSSNVVTFQVNLADAEFLTLGIAANQDNFLFGMPY